MFRVEFWRREDAIERGLHALGRAKAKEVADPVSNRRGKHRVCYEVAKEAVDSVTENHHDEIVEETEHRKNARLRNEDLVERISWNGNLIRHLDVVVATTVFDISLLELDKFRCMQMTSLMYGEATEL